MRLLVAEKMERKRPAAALSNCILSGFNITKTKNRICAKKPADTRNTRVARRMRVVCAARIGRTRTSAAIKKANWTSESRDNDNKMERG